MADYEGVDVAKATCSEIDCDRPVMGRGWCQSHYSKRWRAGLIQPELPLTPRHSLSDVDEERRTATCAVCGPVAIRLRPGRGHECMVRRAEDERRRKRQKKASADDRRRWKYRLTRERFSELMSQNSGKCHICGEEEASVIDHDHACCSSIGSCGECVRGALCHRCNVGLGWFMDSTERMGSAIAYLERWDARDR